MGVPCYNEPNQTGVKLQPATTSIVTSHSVSESSAKARPRRGTWDPTSAIYMHSPKVIIDTFLVFTGLTLAGRHVQR